MDRAVAIAEMRAQLDADLRARNTKWGVRDLEVVSRLPPAGFVLDEIVEMPANNLSSLVFERGEG